MSVPLSWLTQDTASLCEEQKVLSSESSYFKLHVRLETVFRVKQLLQQKSTNRATNTSNNYKKGRGSNQIPLQQNQESAECACVRARAPSYFIH
eukprot:222223-Amphidinium_carterae.1